ncbi:MAG: hypothetical protein H8E28_09255 [Anaerolineae bacterium]|nr:hypothetical protein [Anaerolineae bacterium]MBL6964958.1 hypothetical protein [Anaerolineales bacterium]
MEFMDIPTELTTAATNAVIVVFMLAFITYFRRFGNKDRWKVNLWVWAAGLQCVAVFFGTIVHGFKLPDTTKLILWQPIYLSLGLLVAIFVVAAIYDVWEQAAARRMLPIMLVIGVTFFGVTLIWTNSFLVFVIYQAVAMLVALGGYTWLASKKRLEGAWWMAAGIVTSIVASGIQASKAVSFTLIWPFDHNGTFHLILIVGFIFLTVGLRSAILAEK